MKVAELGGPLLDYWVERALGAEIVNITDSRGNIREAVLYDPVQEIEVIPRPFHASWADGGPIIERERINVLKSDVGNEPWYAVRYPEDSHYIDTTYWDEEWYGATPLIAAMRCFVASKFGDEWA